MDKESGATGPDAPDRTTEPGPPQVRLLYPPGDDLSTLTESKVSLFDRNRLLSANSSRSNISVEEKVIEEIADPATDTFRHTHTDYTHA